MKRLSPARGLREAMLTSVLLTGACASVPNLGAKPTPHAASDYGSSQSLASIAAAWPADGWWRRYGDAQLNLLMNEALAGSPDLQAAAARVRTAEGFAQR